MTQNVNCLPEQPLASRGERALVVALLGGGVLLVLLGLAAWTDTVLARPLVNRLTEGVLAVTLTAIAARKFFFDAARSRRPRLQRGFAIVTAAIALSLVVHAIRPT